MRQIKIASAVMVAAAVSVASATVRAAEITGNVLAEMKASAHIQADNTVAHFTNCVGLSGRVGMDGTTILIGSGSNTWDYPMHTYYHDSRTQVIYMNNEIGSSCSITSLALNVTSVPGQTMNYWTIRMKHTSLSSYGASPVWETDWTTVYQTNEPIGTTGWRTFAFSTPFSYNRTSNLLIDFSHNNSSYISSGFCQCTTGSQNRAIYYCTDSGSGDPLGWPTNGYNPTRNVSLNVPNVRLGVSDIAFVDITNEPATVAYDVTTYTIAGTNSPLTDVTNLVVGSMWWANERNGAHGTFAAAQNWTITNIPVSFGANGITVYGSNGLGWIGFDRLTISRTPPFFLDITNADMVVAFDVMNCAVAGTNTSDIVGDMWVSNALMGGAASSFTRTGFDFTTPLVPVQVGINIITVYGTNAAGVVSADTVTILRVLPQMPRNLTPPANALGQAATPMLTATPFQDLTGAAHATSHWQIAIAGAFGIPLWNLQTGTDLTRTTVPAGVLTNSARYYWRVRYQNTAACWSLWSTATWFQTGELPFAAPEGATNPLGVARGVLPGRVVWAHDPAASFWDGITGYWWTSTVTDQARVDAMLARAVRALAGTTSATAAWSAIFRNFNAGMGRGDRSYLVGETLAIKMNSVANYDNYTKARNIIMTSPQINLALLRQLVLQAGVPQTNIVLYDSGCAIGNCHYDYLTNEFPDVQYVDRYGLGGRAQAISNTAGPIYFSNGMVTHFPPKQVADASYLISMPALKSHEPSSLNIPGTGNTQADFPSLCAKNHFGSICTAATTLHPFQEATNWHGTYHCYVDMLEHKDLGGKTMLGIIDGLYGGLEHWDAVPEKWFMRPFNTNWPASIFISQDQCAIDSVGMDFLVTERACQNDPLRGKIDNYLHEASQITNPPSGIMYDPDHNGPPTRSLGVHEHWLDRSSKLYSRNLNPAASGIELIYVPAPELAGTVREHQVLLRQVTGRTNVAAVACNVAAVIGTAYFNTNTWLFSCVPDFGTAGQVWNIAFMGMNQYGAETQTLEVTVAPRAQKITPKKPLLFEDVDGDLLEIKYNGIKKGNAALVFDGQNIIISNAYAGGKLSFGIKQNKKTGGDGSFILRDVVMDGDGKSVSLAGDIDNVSASQHTLGVLKFTGKRAVASNVWLGAAKTISAGKGMIVGTVAVSNGFATLSAGALVGARILAGVPAGAVVSNTPATAGFKLVKAAFMIDSVVAGRDTPKGRKVIKPAIKVKQATDSTFYHTGTNKVVLPEPILP